MKVAKQKYTENIYSSDRVYCDALLIKWVVMKKLGILEHCEIYDNALNVALVQKLYQIDLWNYISPFKYSEEEKKEEIFKNIEENVALLMATLCPKLKILHDNSIIYGDLKLGNIVMDFDRERKKVIEFGMIDFEFIKEPDDNFTYDFGTPFYRAPEMYQYETGFVLSTKYDVFSLGMALIFVISLEHPFEYREDYHYYSPEDVQPLNQSEIDMFIDKWDILNEEKHKGFKDLLKKMTAVSLDDRYDINQVMNHAWYKKYCECLIS